VKKKLALLIDGGHLRVLCKQVRHTYDPPYVERIARACLGQDEECLRILYYDCPPYRGEVQTPISKKPHQFKGHDGWLRNLAQRDLFAVREGVLKFRGWTPKKSLPVGTAPTVDTDFEPNFQQKGVDMRIGLDIAILAANRAVDRVAILTADTDLVPVMKHARRSGIQVVVLALSGVPPPSRELLEHADFRRTVSWPTP